MATCPVGQYNKGQAQVQVELLIWKFPVHVGGVVQLQEQVREFKVWLVGQVKEHVGVVDGWVVGKGG